MMAEKPKRKREEIAGMPTALDWTVHVAGSAGNGAWRLTRATVRGGWSALRGSLRWTWNAAGWCAYQTWRAVRWSWYTSGRAIAWSAAASWAAVVWTWNLPGRIFRALRGDNSDKPEIVRLIEGRYARRFRFLSHTALFVAAVLMGISRWPYDDYRNNYTWIPIWGVILLLHAIKFLVDEARDRALEKVLERSLWTEREPAQEQPYAARVARLAEDGELVYMVEDEKPKSDRRPQRSR